MPNATPRQRWEKRLASSEDQLRNCLRMMDLLQPEFDAFEKREWHNVYVVRDYVDHMNSAKRHKEEIEDIKQVLNLIGE